MKITTLLTLAIFGTTSLLHSADGNLETPQKEVAELEFYPSTEDETNTAPEETVPQDSPKEVGKASEDGMSSATRDNWIKFGIAATAIAVAVVALVLVSDGKGKKS